MITFQKILYQLILPFALFYLIFYALLNKSKIFGEPKEVKKINAAVSFLLSLLSSLSIYSLNLMNYLTAIGVGIAFFSFVALFLMAGWKKAGEILEEKKEEEKERIKERKEEKERRKAKERLPEEVESLKTLLLNLPPEHKKEILKALKEKEGR